MSSKRINTCLVTSIVAFAMAGLLESCATTNLNSSYVLTDKTTKAVVVLGVKGGYRVIVEQGSLKDKTFQYDKWRSGAEFSITPVNGYIVTVIDATTNEKLDAITRVADPHHFLPPTYYPCGNLVPTFILRPGVITYIGDYSFNEKTKWLDPVAVYDPRTAQEFVRAHYPNLGDVPFVTEHIVNMNVIGEACTHTIFIPIPIK